MSELPDGWAEVPIGNLCIDLFDGPFGSNLKSVDYTEAGVRVVRLENIGHLRFLGDRKTYISHRKYQSLSKHTLQENDIVFSSFVDEEVRVCRVPRHLGLAINKADCFCLRVNPQYAHPSFVTFRLASAQTYVDMAERVHGATRPRVNLSQIREYEISLPSVPEQERIAKKLDAVRARVDDCRERLERVPAILKRFREAVLEAAVSGRLTEEWRETHGATEWSSLSVEALCADLFDGPFGSHLKSADYSDSGVRVVRLENIGHLRFLAERVTYITREKYRSLLKHSLKTRDVVFSSFVDEEVRVCLIPDNLGTAINKADCFCLRVDSTKALPSFVAYRLAATKTYQDMSELVHGATRPRVNLSQLRAYEVSLPPMSEQREIVRRVDELLALVDGLERKYRAAVERVEKLTPAVLAKAFRGELVPQDPNDEPAERLLERIRKDTEAVAERRLPKGGRVSAKLAVRPPVRPKVAAGGAARNRGRRSRAS